jgi:hypothetical protein
VPNVNPNAPTVAPGIPTGSALNKYPQWGVKQTSGTPGYGTVSSDYKVAEAKTAQQKMNLINQNYDIWFTSNQAAQNWVTGQNQNANNPAVQGSNAAASVASGLVNWISQKAIWERAGEVLVGVIIIYIGIKATVTPDSAPNVAKQGVKKTYQYAKTAAKFVK